MLALTYILEEAYRTMDTEEKIIRAALRQFETHGFIAATMKAIAAEAGVAEVTLFRIYGDKKTLFIRAANKIAEELVVLELPEVAAEDFRQSIIRLCRGLLQLVIRYNALFRMLLFEAKKHEELRLILRDVRAGALRNIQALVARYVKLNGETLAAMVEWLGSSLIGASMNYCMFHETEDLQTFTETQAGITADAFVNQCLRQAGEEKL
jgi:AcrR family transcriptional regulator